MALWGRPLDQRREMDKKKALEVARNHFDHMSEDQRKKLLREVEYYLTEPYGEDLRKVVIDPENPERAAKIVEEVALDCMAERILDIRSRVTEFKS